MAKLRLNLEEYARGIVEAGLLEGRHHLAGAGGREGGREGGVRRERD